MKSPFGGVDKQKEPRPRHITGNCKGKMPEVDVGGGQWRVSRAVVFVTRKSLNASSGYGCAQTNTRLLICRCCGRVWQTAR